MSTPREITAGLNAEWNVSGGDYPASDGYALSYVLVMTGKQIIIDASANGSDYSVIVDAATTAAYSPGIYKYQAYVSKGTDKYLFEEGTIEIKPSFEALASGSDTRSTVKKLLDAAEALILNVATKGQKSMQYDGISLDRYELTDLIKLRDKFKAEYASEIRAEKIAKGENIGGKVLVRFTE